MQITPDISIDDGLLQWEFVRSGGPGGQNVNKVSTAVQLRFDLAASSLPADLKRRLATLAGKKLTAGGVLVIDARVHRSQAQNRQAALERLAALIAQAAVRPKPRRATKPTLASKRRRLDAKKHHAQTKRLRGAAGEE
ncbi:MAG: aminoacyl-tRNA hydrolase [Phycisphaerae bacterium]|nr:aminoacyl-tRNA hydrolase [Phycisphaerae bacterium]